MIYFEVFFKKMLYSACTNILNWNIMTQSNRPLDPPAENSASARQRKALADFQRREADELDLDSTPEEIRELLARGDERSKKGHTGEEIWESDEFLKKA
jgi:hypothetical protein